MLTSDIGEKKPQLNILPNTNNTNTFFLILY